MRMNLVDWFQWIISPCYLRYSEQLFIIVNICVLAAADLPAHMGSEAMTLLCSFSVLPVCWHHLEILASYSGLSAIACLEHNLDIWP